MGDIFGDTEVEELEKSYLEQQKMREIAELQYSEDLQVIASTPEGLRVLRNIIAKGKIYNGTPVLGTNDMYFQQGRRSLAIELLEDLTNSLKPNKLFDILISKQE